MTAIEIKAADTLFFRDGKPFEMGDDNWANGMFPNVSPSVLMGALRTTYGSQKRIESHTIAEKTETAFFSAYGLMLSDEMVFPFPLDLVGYKDEKVTHGLDLEDNIASSNPFSKLLLGPRNAKVLEMDKYWLKPFYFNQYLNGKTGFKFGYQSLSNNELLDINDFITPESKIGIGRNRETNTTREGALYRVGMTRLQGKKEGNTVSFFVHVNNLELEDSGILRLGAENKVASYHKNTISFQPSLSNDWGNSGIFKVYLFTPAILKQGIIPEWLDSNFRGEINGVKVRLLTCAVGRHLSFGGFDIKAYKPKPMQKAVPSGSVYYFELENKTDIKGQMQMIQPPIIQTKNYEGYKIN